MPAIAEPDERVPEALFRKRPMVLPKAIPGVGEVLAATIYLEVGQIHRFAADIVAAFHPLRDP